MYGPQGEAERFGPACRVRELGFGAGEVATHEARRGQVDMGIRERLVNPKPLGVHLLLVRYGQARRGRFEVGNGGIELAAQPRHHPEQHLDHRAEPRPPLSRPVRSDSITRTDPRTSPRVT